MSLNYPFLSVPAHPQKSTNKGFGCSSCNQAVTRANLLQCMKCVSSGLSLVTTWGGRAWCQPHWVSMNNELMLERDKRRQRKWTAASLWHKTPHWPLGSHHTLSPFLQDYFEGTAAMFLGRKKMVGIWFVFMTSSRDLIDFFTLMNIKL